QTMMISKMDVAARGMDLTNTAFKSPLLQVAVSVGSELCDWLTHERIPRKDYLMAMGPAEGFAQPNRNGLQVLEAAQRCSEEVTSKFGKFFSSSGALGRRIIPDEYLPFWEFEPSSSWMVTTQTSILADHDEDYATQTFCNLLARRDTAPNARSLRYRLIYPVISKVVSSIHLHTTNMGYDSMPLPEGLINLPKYRIGPNDLALAIESLKENDTHDMVLEMDGCIPVLIGWVYHHWGGHLVI
ncbi:hypothetical protein B0T21DRAFT_274062, partial [Apiosordaria backusii]